ncbi:MAG: hypothetical protein HQ539_01780 [Parcubacteria group bacterium]|nr:hypothetical protein [Parcubacteria group bacterium]
MLTTKEICVSLRNTGRTLTEIMKETGLAKTTIYYHITDIPLPEDVKARIRRDRIKRFGENIAKNRKGKCMPGRAPVLKPNKWSKGLIFLVAHFMFDGQVPNSGCVYNNRSKALVDQVEVTMKQVFNLEPRHYFDKGSGVYRIGFYYVELAIYMRKKVIELKKYITTAPVSEKRLFLKVFFDDEGCVSMYNKKRMVRGYQHNLKTLKLVKKLLKEFDIESKIDEKYQEIVISRKENLIKFRDKINFSKGVYINPNRKNSIWKQKLEKREILDKAINSYLT